MVITVNLDPELVNSLKDVLVARRLTGEKISRSGLINQLIKDYLEIDEIPKIELPDTKVKSRNRIFLTIPSEFSWIPHTLSKVVEIKTEEGKKTSLQHEILVLAAHGFLSDPDYGETLRNLLNDSRR